MAHIDLVYRNLTHPLYYLDDFIFDKVSYITVFETEDSLFKKIEFQDLETAYDFDTQGKLKLVFVELYIHNQEYSWIYKYSINIEEEIQTNWEVLFRKGYYIYEVQFNWDKLQIFKRPVNRPDNWFLGNFLYRFEKTEDNGLEKYVALKEFYDFIPRYKDVYLETIFLVKVMTEHPGINDFRELIPYFRQEKLRIEKVGLDKQNHKPQAKIEIPKSPQQLLFSKLVGLKKVKLEIQELSTLAHFRKKRIEFGLPVTPSTLHLVFTGNPGTGKTTVARLLGQIYHDIGLLAENKVIEVSRNDLVGQYVGHTADKTQKVFESALGGILFIDEAYSLFKGGNDFGAEAVETLLKLMEDNREKIVVIIAGYNNEISSLLASNPGLVSRFPKVLHFDDYSKGELVQIFEKMVKEFENTLSESAKQKLINLIDKSYDSGLFKSNARAIRNLFDEVVKKQSWRLSSHKDLTRKDLTVFIDQDIPEHIGM